MADVDFGRDTSCTDSLKTGRFATGLRLVAEACYRRLTTPRGMLRGGEDEANYGIDLSALCGSTNPRSDASALPGRIRNELVKDERVDEVDVEVLVVTSGAEVSFNIKVTVTTGAGPFTLNVLASSVSVALLGITA